MAHDPTRSWPTGKGPDNTSIPGAAWLEELDGQAFPVVGAGAMVRAGNAWTPASSSNPLHTRDAVLASLIGALNAAKETDPDAASASMLALLRGMLATFGTETTLAAVKAAAESLAQEDFATETTLAALLSAVGNLATEATLSGVKSAVDTLAGTVADGAQKVQLQRSDVEFVSHDATSKLGGAPSGSATRQIAGQNVRVVESASTGAGFMPIDCRGMVSLSVFLENPSSSTRTFFDHFEINFFDTLTPARSIFYAARVSVDFGEVPPGSRLFADLTPYLVGYVGLGLRFHTYDSSSEPGEFTFKFRGIRRPVREV